MKRALVLWPKISEFMCITTIDDHPAYIEQALPNFVANVTEFYAVGSRTFLSHKINITKETFYFHCLRFYLPARAQTIYNRHRVGLGVFSMQGFERRNKESKQVYSRFNNHIDNDMICNLNGLQDIFNLGTATHS